MSTWTIGNHIVKSYDSFHTIPAVVRDSDGQCARDYVTVEVGSDRRLHLRQEYNPLINRGVASLAGWGSHDGDAYDLSVDMESRGGVLINKEFADAFAARVGVTL